MKATNAFPSGPTRTLYASHSSFNNVVSKTSEQILNVMAKILKHQQIKGNIHRFANQLQNIVIDFILTLCFLFQIRRDNDEKFELILGCNDFMLERINSHLDELGGIRKLPESAVLVQSEIQQNLSVKAPAASGSWNDPGKTTESTAALAAKFKTTKLLTARNIPRPQINFKTPVDNANNSPFEPRIRDKPNALKPLAILPEYDDDGDIDAYLHPYEYELTVFQPTAAQLQPCAAPQLAPELSDTPLRHVATEAQLAELVADLRGCTELAIDLEHHSYRTFQGITCLMQISTRTVDYIVDTLALRDELHVLNAVFTDPRVVKVLHGSDSDVEWLQRDLSLYLVNVFDTHQAAKRLQLARLSLAFLLQQYCRLDVDKTFQLADWRIRPLPVELQLYARQDTHYLLYVYDVMRNALLAAAHGQPNLLRAVYGASTEICARRYAKPRCRADSHMDMYARSKRSFDNRQLHALQALYAWRDRTARLEDESCGYVLPNHMMLHVADVLPREMQGIMACCNPIPPLVRQHLHALHAIVLKAREQPLVRALPAAGDEARTTAGSGGPASAQADLSGPLHCPHDLTQMPEFRDDLPTLLNGDVGVRVPATVPAGVAARSACSVFETPDESEASSADEEHTAKLQRIRQLHFVSPFARYLANVPVAEKQRKDEQQRLDEANSRKKLCPEPLPVPVVSAQPTLDAVEARRIAEAANVLPLTEFGKRRREQMLAEQEDQLQTPLPKRARFEINVQPVTDGGPTEGSPVAASTSQPGTPKNGRSAKKAKPTSNKKSGQSSNVPVKFDYAQVDFKKFQGGSAQRVNTHESTSKFHGKGKRAGGHDKKFNKLLTFNKSGGGVASKRK